jgi:hypothetical protein
MPVRETPLKQLLAFALDAEGRVKDKALARRAGSLCRAIHAWASAEHCVAPESKWFEDCRDILRSRFTYALLAGARCAGVLALKARDAEPWLVEVFRSSGAQARAFMLRHSILKPPTPGSASDQLVLMGLADRAKSVQEWACEAAADSGEARYAPMMRVCLAAQKTLASRRTVELYLSIVERGYWLDTPSSSSRRHYFLKVDSGYVASSVPARAFAKHSEPEVMMRVLDSLRHPRGEWAEWLRSFEEPH